MAKIEHKAYSNAELLAPLTIEEQHFVDAYIKYGVGSEAIQAVYPELCEKSKAKDFATRKASALLNKPNVAAEVIRRQEELRDERIADSREVMMYFTAVMRGEVKDQFGLDAPLSERTKAAQEIAKRTVDIESRLKGNQDAAVTIRLDWDRNG